MIPVDAVDDFVAELRPGQLDFADVVFVALGLRRRRGRRAVRGARRHRRLARQLPAPVGRLRRARLGRGSSSSGPGAAKVIAQELPFRSGFHSPLFAPARPGAARAARPPRRSTRPCTPLWSATTCSPYPLEVDAVPGALPAPPARAGALPGARPRARTTTACASSCSSAPGTLTGFIDDTLHDDDHLAVAAASGRHEGLAQLRRLVAGLWVEGMRVDLDRFAATMGATIGADTEAVPAALSDGAVTLDLGTAPGAHVHAHRGGRARLPARRSCRRGRRRPGGRRLGAPGRVRVGAERGRRRGAPGAGRGSRAAGHPRPARARRGPATGSRRTWRPSPAPAHAGPARRRAPHAEPRAGVLAGPRTTLARPRLLLPPARLARRRRHLPARPHDRAARGAGRHRRRARTRPGGHLPRRHPGVPLAHRRAAHHRAAQGHARPLRTRTRHRRAGQHRGPHPGHRAPRP